ncbi:RuBisCO large subunit C-terminal-like domain-containing protein [Acetobacterium wieringae]|uniref:RuBisCO large subunit C-terminal-like domain-containing protein n=1 Tax=Acetobacterium wieringae TaxID=52694 RepID=UPI0026EB3FF3|nr:RuBisCO large subunit C-terminal-like domain-containing protein [Acetobacterium wieringae]
MYIDPIVVQYPEALEQDRFVIATYYCATKPETNIIKFAAAIGIEQSCGTWIKVPQETEEIREKCIGRLVGVYETPAYQIGLPEGISERHLIIRIAYPWTNFGDQFAMLLSTVIGEVAGSGKVKLLDLEFPDSFLQKFSGPKFGIKGIRALLGVYDRPLLNNMIKPCTGMSPAVTAELAYESAVGGVDIIKDDELIANPDHCPLTERVKHVMAALKQADDEKGEKTLYTVNITDRPDRLRENAYRALEAGANALMVNYGTVGLDATRMLTEDQNINVPILGHPAYNGAVYESAWSGISVGLIGAKLPRLSGADMIISFSPYGKLTMLMDTFIDAGYKMIAPLGKIKPVFSMPGGGTTQGHVEDIVKKFGIDVIIASGAGIHGHPMGTQAGARAFRQAIAAAVDGIPTAEAAQEHPELAAALSLWGFYQEGKSGIFDLKG